MAVGGVEAGAVHVCLLSLLLLLLLAVVVLPVLSSSSSDLSSVCGWSVQDVQVWLNEVGLSEYRDAFEREAIDGEVLTELKNEDLSLLGITKLGHRKKIEKEVSRMSRCQGSSSSSSITITQKTASPQQPVQPTQKAQPVRSQTPPAPPPSPPPSSQPPSASAFEAAAKQKPKKKKKQTKKKAQPSSLATPIANHRYASSRARGSVHLGVSERAELSENLRLGLIAHQRNELETARSYYEKVLAIDPFHPRALHMLGLIVMVADGDPDEAIAILEYSLALSDESDTHINIGNFYWQQKQPEKAMSHWETALTQSVVAGGVPARVRYADTAYHTSMAAYNGGDRELCKTYLLNALRLTIEAEALHYPVDHYPPSYQYPEAEEFQRQNLEITHQYRVLMVDSWLHLGLLAEQDGNLALALSCYNKGLQVQPDPLDSQHPQSVQIATIKQELQGYRQALLGRHRDQLTEKALTKAGSEMEGMMVDRNSGRYKKLVEILHKTCHFSPAAMFARLIIDDVIFHSPDYKFLYQTNAEIIAERKKYDSALNSLLADNQMKGLWSQPHGLEWCRFRFYVAYHGLNNKQLNEKLAKVYLHLAPSLDYTAPYIKKGQVTPYHGERKIRVGFMSAFLTSHPVGRTLQGYIEHLPRDKFEILIFFITLQPGVDNDSLLLQMKKWADRFVALPVERTVVIREMIEAEKPDVLIYGDIGMEPTSFFMSFSRLAPIQALTFGHPDTSGVSNMDYYISHENMDDQQHGQLFYTEKLVSLPGIGYWHKADVPNRIQTREEVGLADHQLGLPLPKSRFGQANAWTMYLVTKSVQFYSPDFVDALAEILARHQSAILVMVVDIGRQSRGFDLHNQCQESILDGIEARLLQYEAEGEISADTLQPYLSSLSRASLSSRVRFVDKGDHDYFMSLLSMTDVLLQPLPLDGTTTTLEALSLATPTVLFQGPMIGGRMGSAIYQHVGTVDNIAHSKAEYVDIALKFGLDAEYNQEWRKRVKKQTAERRLFQDPAAITAMADWLQSVVTEKLG